ncbi:MAG TPA: sigma-70 family RNA polymerase sigma factor [Myxococcaceae bacterium]|nr:sigma-70 family RNA polymerase sigma factor [Myxococcaceae bacterium]
MAPEVGEQQHEQEDRELLSRAQAGDADAFEALVARHRDDVFALALRITRSEADAAEIAQDTFLSAYQHLPQFRGDAAFGSWVYRIAANNALMRLRRQRVKQAAESELRGPEFNERGSLVDPPNPNFVRAADEEMLDAELGAAIQQATDQLPESYRQVFLLRDVDGLSYDEIAAVTGESVAAIKSRLHRARLALREAIEAFYREKT